MVRNFGKPDVCVAVLDGAVDKFHSCLASVNLIQIETFSDVVRQGQAPQHGTHIASVIFGQHNNLVKSIAPHCRGLIVPIFTNGDRSILAPCTQIDLAIAILQVVQHGANIINISGGQLTLNHCHERQLQLSLLRLVPVISSMTYA